MAQSLRDRLLGRTGELTTGKDGPAPDANAAPGHPAPPTPAASSSNGKGRHPRSGISAPDPTRQMVRRHDSGVVSPVEKLKLELHRKLLDRLDLAALERVTDETVLVAQIRQAVSEFLRNETP